MGFGDDAGGVVVSHELKKTDLLPFPSDWMMEELHRRHVQGFNPPCAFQDNEKELMHEALRMLWQERLERIGKYRANNYQPAEVAETATLIDIVRKKLGVDSL